DSQRMRARRGVGEGDGAVTLPPLDLTRDAVRCVTGVRTTTPRHGSDHIATVVPVTAAMRPAIDLRFVASATRSYHTAEEVEWQRSPRAHSSRVHSCSSRS